MMSEKKITTIKALDMSVEALCAKRRQLFQYKMMYEQGFEYAKAKYELWKLYDEAIQEVRRLKGELFPDAGPTWEDPDRFEEEELC